MPRVSRSFGQQLQQIERTRDPVRQRRLRPPNERGLRLLKLDDHLPAPTDSFESASFTPTTVTGKFWRRTGQLITDHYEEDDREDDEGNGLVTVVNRFPWVWIYKHDIITVERFQGEWIPRQPHFSIVLGKTTTAHGKGDTESVNVYWHATTAGSETVTAYAISAYNRWADLDSGKLCELQWRYNGWKIVNGEC